MKKIGIITLVRVNNYGAELQAFATQKALQLMGYDAEIIDYHYFTNPRHIKSKGSKPRFKMPLKLTIIVWLYPLYQLYKRFKQDKLVLGRRIHNFEEFHNKHSRFSIEYRTAESLESANMDYDVYIVGSDQVWNPYNYTSLDPYFLKFAPQDKTKVSYASSFGISSLPTSALSYYRDALHNLDAVGVREENAVQIVENVSGIKAQWVLDPTLLLPGREWEKYGKEVPFLPNRYVLIYEITPCPFVKELSMNVAQKLGCKVVRINREAIREEKEDEVINVMDAGPSEFIWLFKNATMIITNSFHGTAFSINFQKNFYVVIPKRKQNNSRQQSLLHLVELDNRLLVEGSPYPDQRNFTVDYKHVLPVLEIEREKSFRFLNDAING